jgi:iron complex transport system ATP-binding protein
MSGHATDAIQLTGVSLRRGETWILRDIDWSVPVGTCAAILGPNGSGKSTLTRILACHLWPTSGTVRVAGGNFGESSLPELRKHIRLVQSAGPYDVDPQLTALEAVLTGFFGSIGLYDTPTDAMRARAAHLLDHVGLSHVSSHTYATLSSGERVRTLIARALAERPRLLLLDEPTAGLDLLAREQVLATVQRLFESSPSPPYSGERGGERGYLKSEISNVRSQTPLPSPLPGVPGRGKERTTVVLITHHIEELPPATSQVLLLSEGGVAARGTPEQVLRADVLSRVYRCPLEVRRQGNRFYVEVHPAAWDDLLSK